MRTITLHGKKAAGRVALVDDEDYDRLVQYRWAVWERVRPGGGTDGPYAVANMTRGDGKQTSVKMHKFLTGYARTDHKDRNGLNNQRSNLRPADHAQNGYNTTASVGGASAYKGVSWHKGGKKWMAELRSDGVGHYLGLFTNEEAAALAYDDAARQRHGEFACFNFPDTAGLEAVRARVAALSPDVKPPQTHCTNDHELTPENSYVYTDHKGMTHKGCRRCRRDSYARWKEKVRAAKSA